MNRRLWIIIAGLCGFTGVALGAFGAHGLRNILTEEMLKTYNTGILYHLIHAAAILALALSANKRFGRAAAFLLFGIILFSFSLYVYSLTGISWIAMITPLGGISFLTGWLLIIVAALKKESEEKTFT